MQNFSRKAQKFPPQYPVQKKRNQIQPSQIATSQLNSQSVFNNKQDEFDNEFVSGLPSPNYQMQSAAFMTASIANLQKQLNERKKKTQKMEDILSKMHIDMDKAKQVIKDQKNWIKILTSVGNGSKSSDQIRKMKDNDSLRNEKFELKRLLLYQRKKYADLKKRYLNLQSEQKFREVQYQRSDKAKIFAEKLQLQSVLKDLSDEVQFLSRKNDEFLKQLKVKNYYQQYAKVKKELISLKEAHIILIEMYNPFKYSDLTNSMMRSPSKARISATSGQSFFSSMFQSSKDAKQASSLGKNPNETLDPDQVLHMSPSALKEKLCSPRQERNRFSIWTCGTSRPQPTNYLNTSQFDNDQSFYFSNKNNSVMMKNNNVEYNSNYPYNASSQQFGRMQLNSTPTGNKQYVPTKRSSGRYHLSRADQWEASKNLRHLMNKNVNFLHVGSEHGDGSESPYLKTYSKKADNSYLGSMNTTANQNLGSIMGRGSQNEYAEYSSKTPKDESILAKTTGQRSTKNLEAGKTIFRERAGSSNLM